MSYVIHKVVYMNNKKQNLLKLRADTSYPQSKAR